MAAPAQTPAVLSTTAVSGGYAGVVSRAIALGIDAALVQGVLLLIAALCGLVASLVGGFSLGTVAQAIAAAAWLLATAGYFVVCWSAAGQTVGMRLMQLQVVVPRNGRAPAPARSIIRVMWLGLCIIPFFAGFVPCLFDDRRRGVHDMLSGTVVVHVPVAP
jgi:uncharacterized RDD family membrane protein YckC